MGQEAGDTMNLLLSDYSGRYFITVRSDYQVTTGLLEESLGRLQQLSHEYAGIIGRAGPDGEEIFVIWKTEAVTSASNGGKFFPGKDQMPFDELVVRSKLVELASEDWLLDTVYAEGASSKPARKSPWKKQKELYELIVPMLERPRAPSAWSKLILTVVICTYNNSNYLPWAVQSVLRQTSAAWELVIVNDGSTDSTFEKLQPYVSDHRIRIIHNKSNKGKSRCLNQALEMARGNWLLELDADDWLAPDCAASLLQFTRSTARHSGALYGNFHEWQETAVRGLVYKAPHITMPTFHAERLLQEGLPLAPRLYKVSVLRSMGGWCESSPFEGRYFEDFEMLIRLALRYPILKMDRLLYHRRLRASSITRLHSDKYTEWLEWIRLQHDSSDPTKK